MSDRAPAYVSARSADEILSNIRPTRIKSESLRSLNIFLDELLWLILHSARSLATNRLKAGLLQIMPSAVGKDAVLEAEVELRAYRQRSPHLGPEEPGIKQADFPLQPTFELLRQKCEAYCTLGDIEENVAVESALQEKMLGAGPCAPKAEQVIPAALYLTAILEHVCEHVLNNVGQVVARDSSRGTAYALDVYTALCEDTAIYPLFKTMKVHGQIETQSRAFRPSHGASSSISGGSRTRSISRIKPNEDLAPVRKMSILSTSSSIMPTTSSPTNTSSLLFGRRPSADVVLATSHKVVRSPSAVTQSSSSKSSLERTRSSLERITGKKSLERSNSTREKSSRGIKLFGKGGGRNSSEDGLSSLLAPFPSVSVKEVSDELLASSQSDGTHRDTMVQQGPKPESDAGDESDGLFAQDFDELMRSGATMKVSLTPDRLKTFEVFAKQKNQRPRGRLQDSSSSEPPPVPALPTSYSPESSNMVLAPRTSSTRRDVDAILEADETTTRSRTQSLAPQFLSEEPQIPSAPVPPVPAVAGRSRSQTESGTTRPSIGTKPSNDPALLRKASFNGSSRTRSGSDTTPPNEPSTRTRKVSEAPRLATMAATPTRKRGPARRRESMDLDDIINDPVTPRRGSSAMLVAKPAHQTANTRDLIDFLSEGPPEPSLYMARSASQGALDPTGPSGKSKPSGSSRWFKRFVGGASTSGERSISVPEVPESAPATRILGKQRSEKNLRGTSTSGLTAYGKVPPSPALSVDTGLHPHPSLNLGRRVSPNRKAVPAWNEDGTPRPADPNQIQIQTTLSPQRDVFGGSGPHSEPARSLSPASSKPSLRRVPVPKLDDDTSSRVDVSEHGLQLIPEPVSAPKTPELGISKHERRRPEKILDPSVKIQDKSRQATRPASPVGNVTPNQAAELRAAIAHATSADECRMLLDLVLGQWGLGRHAPEPSAVPPLSAGCSEFDDADEAMAVDMLLGEGTVKPDRQWPLTPKDSYPKLFEARVAGSLRSSE
ncbi:Titin [Rhizoctonia solani]|uniref:Titin n=1 Tax=Rhizoctonia solani TaxID=456999 RepID=A0A0K6FVS7_9AGAM|nr:Titin [Rhizoctonia solani]